MRFLEINPEKLTESQWESYFENREVMYRESNPRDPLPSRNLRRAYMLNPHPDYDISWWFILDDSEKVLGTGGLWWAKEHVPNYIDVMDHVNLALRIERTLRSETNQLALLTALLERVQKIGKEVIRVECEYEDQFHFWDRFDGEVKAERAESRLYLEDVNWQQMEQWKATGPKRAPKVNLELFHDVPENDIEEFCIIYTETFNQAPAGDLAAEIIMTPEKRREYEEYFKTQGYEWTTMITREDDGSISGLTEIFYREQESFLIEQDLTGVKKEYRGRGLGKWLKSEMLLYIRERYPDGFYIRTGNNTSNAAMLSINDRMGFKVHTRQRFYEFKVEQLRI